MMSLPVPVVIWSLPPRLGAIVVMSPRVSGWLPNCGESAAAASLHAAIQSELGWGAVVPRYLEQVRLD